MMRGWTYGAEFELSDWPRGEPVPAGMGLDLRDVTMVNSSGVAVDPRGELHDRGGEILAQPSETPNGVADQLAEIMTCWPETSVNYRSNLHVHVRVPGLRDDLGNLKLLQRRIHEWMPVLLPLVEPIPVPWREDYPDPDTFKGARARVARRRVSHQKLLNLDQLARQAAARTPEEFFTAEALHVPTGRVHWATHPRACVNIRQLLQTDTVEFRHFPGTVHPEEVHSAAEWCSAFMEASLSGDDVDPLRLAREFGPAARPWPAFEPYVHWLEEGYVFTSRKFHTPDAVRKNIAEWLSR